MTDVRAGGADVRIGEFVTLACLLEASALKPGNVHPQLDFDDMTFADMCRSARAIGPVLDRARQMGLGATILAAVDATRKVVGVNTNLGTILLLVPLAMTDDMTTTGIAKVVQSSDGQDAANIFEAILCMQPGGLGKTQAHDVGGPPPDHILQAMSLAASRDLVARQYTNGFAELLNGALPCLASLLDNQLSLMDAIVRLQLTLLARYPDSLIRRKCGVEIANHAASRAGDILACVDDPATYEAELAAFDDWLRADGNRRNPGTTADLIAATLFSALRLGILGHAAATAALPKGLL